MNVFLGFRWIYPPISNEFRESIANPPYIFESCLSRVTVSIEYPYSILDNVRDVEQQNSYNIE